MKEICNKCADYLNKEIAADDTGTEVQMARRHAGRVIGQESRHECTKMCTPMLECVLWFESARRKENHA